MPNKTLPKSTLSYQSAPKKPKFAKSDREDDLKIFQDKTKMLSIRMPTVTITALKNVQDYMNSQTQIKLSKRKIVELLITHAKKNPNFLMEIVGIKPRRNKDKED